MKRAFIPTLCILALLASCGSDDPADPDGNGNELPNGTFSATVNGSAFDAVFALASLSGGTAAIGATDAQGRSVGFSFNTSGPGTYTFQTSIGNYATYGEGSATWAGNGALSATTGTVSFSTLNASRAVGTFSFSMQPNGGGASGTRSITGSFDLTVGS
jgi:hypothetical protein